MRKINEFPTYPIAAGEPLHCVSDSMQHTGSSPHKTAHCRSPRMYTTAVVYVRQRRQRRLTGGNETPTGGHKNPQRCSRQAPSPAPSPPLTAALVGAPPAIFRAHPRKQAAIAQKRCRDHHKGRHKKTTILLREGAADTRVIHEGVFIADLGSREDAPRALHRWRTIAFGMYTYHSSSSSPANPHETIDKTSQTYGVRA